MQFAGWLPTPQLLPILIYEDNVNMDSGASDHMHPDRAQLTNVVPYFTDVILPKGANINVIEAGTLLVSCLNLLHKVRHIIPLLNTLHVPGLRTTLWSVIKFAVIPLFLAIQQFASSCTTVVLIPLNSASRILSINQGTTHLVIASKHLLTA